MARIHGKNAVLFIKEYKISGDANRLNFTYNTDTTEVSGFETQGKEHVEGNYGWTIGMDGFWNSDANKSDPVIFQLVGLGTHIVGIYPQGTTPGRIGYDGQGALTSYNHESPITGAVVFSTDMQGNNKLYRQQIMHAGVTIATGAGAWFNLGTLNPGGNIAASLRALSGSHGTASGLIINASTSPVGVDGGNVVTFSTNIAAGVQLKTIGTAVNVGPYWRADFTVPNGDSFDFIISCGINQ